MAYVAGHTEITDLDEFLASLDEIGRRHQCIVQAVDGRYVAGPHHLEQAVTYATEAINDGKGIADDPAIEILLYIAGTRQIERAIEIGVSEGRQQVVIVITGEDEETALDEVKELLLDTMPLNPDADRLQTWFGITEAEQEATHASLEQLVCERVVLLVLDR